MASISSARLSGRPAARQIMRRWLRAVRPRCALDASSTAPTRRIGSESSEYLLAPKVADPAVGQRIKAIVVLQGEARGKVSEEEIKTYCRQSLAEYKVPHIVEFRGELPKTVAKRRITCSAGESRINCSASRLFWP